MVRTYEEATLVYENGLRHQTTLDDFFLMGGSEGVLTQCPPGAYTYTHEQHGVFELHCTICLEHGCTYPKFQRITQVDKHKNKFFPDLKYAYFKHSENTKHHPDCICETLSKISTNAAKIKVRAIYTEIYLLLGKSKEIRFFFKARKPDELNSKQWAMILRKLINENPGKFPDQDEFKYYQYAIDGHCPDWFVTEFIDNISTSKKKLGGIIYRIQGTTIPHSSTCVWSSVDDDQNSKLKNDFFIDGKVRFCEPLSPNQSGMIGFTNSSRITDLFTLITEDCHSHHPTKLSKYQGEKTQNYPYQCVDFSGKHLHFTHFKKISDSKIFFEDVQRTLSKIGNFNLEFNHKEIKILEFDVDIQKKTAIFFVKPNQRLNFILRHYDDSNDLRGRALNLERIKYLTESGRMNQELKESYAAKINSRKPKRIEIYEEGIRYLPVGFEIKGSGVLEIQSDDGLIYQKRYIFEGQGESLSINRIDLDPDFAYNNLWDGKFDPRGYTPPDTLSKSRENTGARILDICRHKKTSQGSQSVMNKLVSLGFQYGIFDESIGKFHELHRSFSERMEIIRDITNNKKIHNRKGLAIGPDNSEYLLLIDRRSGHKLGDDGIVFLSNGCRLIPRESDLIEHRLDRFPDLLMYPENPGNFLSVYLDERNHAIQEPMLEENFEKLIRYTTGNSETEVYIMKEDDSPGSRIWERRRTLIKKDINSNIWTPSLQDSQTMAKISSMDFGESTIQIARTYSYNEDELFNPHIHQFYLLQYRKRKNPIAHKIFSNTTNDDSFYPKSLSKFFKVGNDFEKRIKQYQYLNDSLRAMYVILNREKLSRMDAQDIVEDILWWNMPTYLTRWVESDKSPLSLLKEVRDIDSKLAISLEKSIHNSMWIPI